MEKEHISKMAVKHKNKIQALLIELQGSPYYLLLTCSITIHMPFSAIPLDKASVTAFSKLIKLALMEEFTIAMEQIASTSIYGMHASKT